MERVEPEWLTRAIIDAIQSDQIRQHGGSYGTRDSGLIESALARPIQYEPGSDLHKLAAAYGFGLARNHGYIDGNKRVAFAAMYVFLGLNGLELDAAEPEAVMVMLEVAAGGREEERLAEWLRERTVPLSED